MDHGADHQGGLGVVVVVVGALGQASSRSQVRVGINYVSFLGWGKQDLP